MHSKVHGGTVDAENASTSGVTNMSGWFNSKNEFNEDISSCNVSNVTTMYKMFNYASAFNQNIGNWNTSSVQQVFHINLILLINGI